MTIDLTKCVYPANDTQEIKSDDICKKYLLGTYNQEEAMQLVKKYVAIFDQTQIFFHYIWK